MKQDERDFLLAVYQKPNEKPRTIGEALGLDQNRIAYLCGKWADKGWYEFGVAVDMGWLTREGREAAEGLSSTTA